MPVVGPVGACTEVEVPAVLRIVAVYEVVERAGAHAWVLRDWDGEVLARNGGYLTRAAAMQDIERLRVAAVTANVVEA